MGTGQRVGSMKSNEGVVEGVTGLAGSSRSSNDLFERRKSIGSGFFSFLDKGIAQIFS